MVNVLECKNSDILVWQGQAKSTVGKNVVNGKPRKDKKRNIGHQGAIEKDESDKNKLRITIRTVLHKGPTKGGLNSKQMMVKWRQPYQN